MCKSHWASITNRPMKETVKSACNQQAYKGLGTLSALISTDLDIGETCGNPPPSLYIYECLSRSL